MPKEDGYSFNFVKFQLQRKFAEFFKQNMGTEEAVWIANSFVLFTL